MKHKHEREDVPYLSHLEESFHKIGISLTDPLGSYTGIPVLPADEPVQDADDL
ncbi:MAG: 5-deoxy-glucuronate isomerase [Ruminococcaceae bacterium]|nr:5-deoxy-glucuronate isomerase [Oscillospiraceae bacterium]